MKKLIFLGLVVVLTMSCQNSEPRFFTSSPEIDDTKALVSDYENGNWENWVTHYSDTAKIYHNTWENGTSPAETQENLKEILSNVSKYKFDEENVFYEMIIDDNGKTWVNFWGNWRANIAANGQELQIPVHLSLNYVEGKIVEEYGFYDVSQFMAALSEIEATKANENVLESQ